MLVFYAYPAFDTFTLRRYGQEQASESELGLEGELQRQRVGR
jgi:hypothetical protein